MEPKGCVEEEVFEHDGVSFPSANLHFLLEVGFFERVVGEFSHARVAVGVGAFLRDVGSVVVEEADQLFARCNRAFSFDRRKPVREPSRQVYQGGAGGKGEHGRKRASQAVYMASQGALIAFVVLIFGYVFRQQKIDEEFDFHE